MVGKRSLKLVLPVSLLLLFSLASPMASAQEPLPPITVDISDDLDARTSCSHTFVVATASARDRNDGEASVFVEIEYIGAPTGGDSDGDSGGSYASAGVSEDGVFVWVKATAFAESSSGVEFSTCTNGINPGVCCGGAWGDVETVVHELPLP